MNTSHRQFLSCFSYLLLTSNHLFIFDYSACRVTEKKWAIIHIRIRTYHHLLQFHHLVVIVHHLLQFRHRVVIVPHLLIRHPMDTIQHHRFPHLVGSVHHHPCRTLVQAQVNMCLLLPLIVHHHHRYHTTIMIIIIIIIMDTIGNYKKSFFDQGKTLY